MRRLTPFPHSSTPALLFVTSGHIPTSFLAFFSTPSLPQTPGTSDRVMRLYKPWSSSALSEHGGFCCCAAVIYVRFNLTRIRSFNKSLIVWLRKERYREISSSSSVKVTDYCVLRTLSVDRSPGRPGYSPRAVICGLVFLKHVFSIRSYCAVSWVVSTTCNVLLA
jgi:hypothetical protein